MSSEPVVVEIEERDAAAHRLHDVLLLGRRVVLKRDPRLTGDIAKEKVGRPALCWGRLRVKRCSRRGARVPASGNRQTQSCECSEHNYAPGVLDRHHCLAPLSAPTRFSTVRRFS